MTTPQKHQTAFLILLTVSFLVGWRPLLETLSLSWHNNEYTHIAMIIPLSAVLVLMRWERVQRTTDWGFVRGCTLLLLAIAIAFGSYLRSTAMTGDIRLTIQMFALVLSWIGIFVSCFGQLSSRWIKFPLLFLFGLVPFPRVVLDFIIAVLQEGSAWSAHMFCASFGVPVLQEGVRLTVPGLTVEVAQECSSIRSSSILVVTAIMMAEVLLHSPWRKALLVAIAIPLSVIKNGLRIFTIAMLGTRVDPGYLTGRLHHEGGVVFLAMALLALAGILWVLRKGEKRPLAFQPLESTVIVGGD